MRKFANPKKIQIKKNMPDERSKFSLFRKSGDRGEFVKERNNFFQ